MNLLSEEELKELNRIANVIISNEIEYPLDLDLLLYIFRKMSREPSLKQPSKEIKLELSREKILKYTLDFFRTIDIEYYNEALEFLLQLNKNKRLEMFYSKKDKLSKEEKEAIKLEASYSSKDLFDDVSIFIPIGINETREERENNFINRASIEESFKIVHEIAHNFDRISPKEMLSRTIDMDEESYNRMLKEIKDNNKVRNAFHETTAITFESIYADYLKGKVQSDVLKRWIADRYNIFIIKAEICYDNLSIADIKRKKGIIRNEDVEQLMKENKDSAKMIRQRIDRIFQKKGNIKTEKRYALAGLFAPTLAEKYKQQGAEVLKQYLNSVKNNSVDDVFQSVQVSQNEEGYDKLLENLKKQIEPFLYVKDKKCDGLER